MSRKKHSTLRTQKPRPCHGRPSKANRDEILRRDAWLIARELRQHPLRDPVDAQFRPYYNRIRDGDPASIAEYAHKMWPRLDPSFYELIGHLFFLSHYAGVKRLLREVSGSSGIDNRKSYEYWYRKLLPLCQSARRFIEQAHASKPEANRNELWYDYISQPLPRLNYKHFAGLPDEERFQREANELDRERRRLAIEELQTTTERLNEDAVRSYFKGLGCRGKELEAMTQSKFHLQSVDIFSPFGMLPHQIFFDLALTRKEGSKRRFVWKPADVACRYACKIVRVSESWARHKGECK